MLEQLVHFDQLLEISLIHVSLFLAHVLKELLILSAELLQLPVILTGLVLCQLTTTLSWVALAELELKFQLLDLGFKREVALL
jgi:hypothetical protein